MLRLTKKSIKPVRPAY